MLNKVCALLVGLVATIGLHPAVIVRMTIQLHALRPVLYCVLISKRTLVHFVLLLHW